MNGSEKTLVKGPSAKVLKVLFVCEDNITKSQIAEEFFSEMCGGKAVAESAGIGDLPKAMNGVKLKDVSYDVPLLMKRVGRDVSDNIVKFMSKKMFDGADRVVLMTDPKNAPAYVLDSNKVVLWNVKDMDMACMTFNERCAARDEIKRMAEELAMSVTAELLRP